MHVYLGLGTNIGDRESNLRRALNQIKKKPDIELVKISHLYETEPVGYENQPWFYNMVIEIETGMDIHSLHEFTKSIETRISGQRLIKWGPRAMDIDILLCDDKVISEPDLKVPHPHLTERAFVMLPLQEIAPSHKLPDGRTVTQVMDDLRDKHAAKKISQLT